MAVIGRRSETPGTSLSAGSNAPTPSDPCPAGPGGRGNSQRHVPRGTSHPLRHRRPSSDGSLSGRSCPSRQSSLDPQVVVQAVDQVTPA
eukprot:14494186-Heterocapsa_arctica.AAC.1